jgi:hypothetical protein
MANRFAATAEMVCSRARIIRDLALQSLSIIGKAGKKT